MRVCVTGATGFIGSHLIKTMDRTRFSIKALTRKPAMSFPEHVEVVVGDLTSRYCPYEEILEDTEVIIHCAGMIGDQSMMRRLHVNGTYNLLQAVTRNFYKTGKKIHWVQLSSVGVYGPPMHGDREGRIIDENSPIRPVGTYEITKEISDRLVIRAGASGVMTYTILRPSNVFGVDMTNQSLRGLIRMVGRRLFFYIGRPGAVATYIHVDDVVNALMKCSYEPQAIGQVYNLSCDCFLEDLIDCISSSKSIGRPFIRIPESVARMMVRINNGCIPIPLNTTRIDALVNRTRYPSDKIINELFFLFTKPMPVSITEML